MEKRNGEHVVVIKNAFKLTKPQGHC